MTRLIFIIHLMIWSDTLLSKGLPVLVSHSETRIIMNQGDTVNLEVNSKVSSDDIQWWVGKEKICSGKYCKIETQEWNPGPYKIIAIIANDQGSEFVSFYLNIKERLKAGRFDKISPELIVVDTQVQNYKKGQYYGLASSGNGFAWKSDNLYVLKSLPRLLDWSEKIKSSGGTIQFGVEALDEFALLPGGEARLVLAEGRRIVRVLNGVLRARQLDSGKVPNWSVIVGDWLQLDGSAVSDFAVEYKSSEPSKATLLIFSGQVRVIQDKLGENKEIEPRVFPAGTKILLKRGKNKPISKILPRKLVKRIFKKSSPEIFLDFKGSLRNVQSQYQGDDFDNPISWSEKLLADRNFSRAISILGTGSEQMKKTSKWKTLFGKALGGINLAKASLDILKGSYKEVRNGEIAFEIGLRYFENNNWDKAKDWFSKASEDDFNRKQILYYYLGVLAFKNKDYPLADRHFKESNWYAESQEIIDSIESFRDLMMIVDTWGAHGTLEFILDSNLFKTSDKENLSFQEEILGLSGYGYYAKGDIWKGFLQGKNFGLRLGYSIDRLGWIKKSLREVDQVNQQIYSGFYFGRKKWLQGVANISTRILGSDRALDGIGMKIKMKNSGWFCKPDLHLNLQVFKDPLPGKADVIDILSGDLQGASSDRSSRLIGFELLLSPWQKPRQEVVTKFYFSNRVFTNTLVESETYSVSAISASYLLRFWGLSLLSLEGKVSLKSFPSDLLGRKDTTTSGEVQYRFEMEHDGNFHFGFKYEDRTSTDSLYRYSKYSIRTGVLVRI